jgi:phosphate/sulfate permease
MNLAMTIQKLNSYQWIITPICALLLAGVMFTADARYVKHEHMRDKEATFHRVRENDIAAITAHIGRVELEAKAKASKLEGMIESGRVEAQDINRRLERIIAQLEMVLKRMEGF